jgi:NAD-dependent deacetylase
VQKKIVVLSGAGISAESGLKTFRDAGGLWEGHRPEDVATPQAWLRDQEMVLRFYNQRRRDAKNAEPNAGHLALAELEKYYNVSVITQNVDDLHERAGSSDVSHLHGSLFESRSTFDPSLVYPIDGEELNIGDKCDCGYQLRPNIVWFGEDVPMMVPAIRITQSAHIFIVVGTSLVVYPAASLVAYVPPKAPIYIVDPNIPDTRNYSGDIRNIAEKASIGMPKLAKQLIAEARS